MSIDRLWPDPASDLDDEQLLEVYAPPAGEPWLRMNFVASLDGAVTHDGRSGGLGGPSDHRVFALLRRHADAVLVGAGTARIERYEAMRVDDASARWRVDHGMPPHPVLVLVSGRLDLDPASLIFADAPVRPVVYTVAASPAERRAALAAVADVVDAGETEVDPVRVRDDLIARGLPHIHGEGGPTLFGSFLVAGAVDELCLTLAPRLEAGPAGRIVHDVRPAPTGMRLASLLRGGDELLLRYVRTAPAPTPRR